MRRMSMHELERFEMQRPTSEEPGFHLHLLTGPTEGSKLNKLIKNSAEPSIWGAKGRKNLVFRKRICLTRTPVLHVPAQVWWMALHGKKTRMDFLMIKTPPILESLLNLFWIRVLLYHRFPRILRHGYSRSFQCWEAGPDVHTDRGKVCRKSALCTSQTGRFLFFRSTQPVFSRRFCLQPPLLHC